MSTDSNIQMRLHLIGFRCHLDREFIFQDGQVILLKGPSGIGKSTVFQAIYWCLYSGRYNIYNQTQPEHPCSVTLDLGTIRIFRKKRPERLVVTYQGRDYEDKVGQDIINSLFGVEDVWLACCYILQNTRSPLLEANQAERMKILNRLSFSTDNPDIYLDKINTTLQQTQGAFDETQKVYTAHKTAFDAEWNLFGQHVQTSQLDMTKQLSPEQMLAQQKTITTKRELSTQLQREIFFQQQLRGQITALQDERQSVLTRKQGLPEALAGSDLEMKTQELRVLTEQLGQTALFEEVKRAQEELAGVQRSLEKLPSNSQTYTQEDLAKALSMIETARLGKGLCERHGCEYTQGAVESRRQQLKDLLGKQTQLRHWHQLRSLEKQLGSISGPNMTEADYLAAREVVTSLQATVNVLQCPHCKGNLRAYPSQGGHIQLTSSDKAAATSEQIIAAQANLNTVHTQRMMTLDRENLQKQLAYLRTQGPPDTGQELEVPLQQGEFQKYSLILDDLGRVQFVGTIPDLGVIRQGLEQQQLLRRKETLQAQLQRIMGSATHLKMPNPEDVRAKALHLRQELDSQRDRNIQFQNLTGRLQEIDVKLGEMYLQLQDNPQTRFETTQQEIQALEAHLSMAQKIQQVQTQQLAFQTRYQGLYSEQIEVGRLYARLVNLQKFKEMAIDLEYRSLQATVDTINSAIADVVQVLFEDPIEVTISLFRNLKTKDRMKPDVHVEIQYKGVTYSSVSHLSGGEADRVSLALTLALGRMNSCPLLLLDESMASLDSGVKEACIRVLRSQVCGSKTIISIAHDFVEGRMDSVIDMTPVANTT